MTTGEKIVKLRKQAGYSQETFSEMLGISRQAVSKWENGTATPTNENLVRIARIFNVQVSSLLDDGAIEINSSRDAVTEENFSVEKKKNSVTNVVQSAAIIVLSLAVIVQGISIGRLQNEMADIVSQAADTARLQREIESLRSYVYSLPSAYTESSKDFTDYHYESIDYDFETNIATLEFSVVPTDYTRNTRAKIVIKGSGETFSADAGLENDIFTATLDVYCEDSLPVYLYLTDNGRTRSFLLDYIPNPADSYRLQLSADALEGEMKLKDGELTVKGNYDVTVDYTISRDGSKSVYPAKAVLEIYADGRLIKELPHENIMDYDFVESGEIDLSMTTAHQASSWVSFGMWIDETIKDERIKPGSDISFVLRVHDNNGREYEQTAEMAYLVK